MELSRGKGSYSARFLSGQHNTYEAVQVRSLLMYIDAYVRPNRASHQAVPGNFGWVPDIIRDFLLPD